MIEINLDQPPNVSKQADISKDIDPWYPLVARTSDSQRLWKLVAKRGTIDCCTKILSLECTAMSWISIIPEVEFLNCKTWHITIIIRLASGIYFLTSKHVSEARLKPNHPKSSNLSEFNNTGTLTVSLYIHGERFQQQSKLAVCTHTTQVLCTQNDQHTCDPVTGSPTCLGRVFPFRGEEVNMINCGFKLPLDVTCMDHDHIAVLF